VVTNIGFFNIEFPFRFPFTNTSTNLSGGAGHSLVDLITHLDLSQYDCKIFSVGNKKTIQKEVPKNNLGLYRFPTIGSLLQNRNKPFSVLPSLEIFFKSSKFNFDLIHCQLGYPGSELPALYYLQKNDVPFVLSVRGAPKIEWGSKRRQIFMKIYFKTLFSTALERSDIVIIPTKGLLKDYPKLKKCNNIKVVPNGIDFETFSKYNKWINWKKPPMKGLGKFDNTLLFVGSLVEGKGIKTLLRSFERVLKKFPNTCLVIVGNGPMESNIKDRSKRKEYAEKIFLPGYISEQDKLSQIYSYSDLFVFPSLAETFGRVVLESMAAGTPCLVSDIGALLSVIQDGEFGFSAQRKNPKDFAKKIEYFFEMEENKREQLEKKVVEYARSHSWEDVARQMEDIYEGLLE